MSIIIIIEGKQASQSPSLLLRQQPLPHHTHRPSTGTLSMPCRVPPWPVLFCIANFIISSDAVSKTAVLLVSFPIPKSSQALHHHTHNPSNRYRHPPPRLSPWTASRYCFSSSSPRAPPDQVRHSPTHPPSLLPVASSQLHAPLRRQQGLAPRR